MVLHISKEAVHIGIMFFALSFLSTSLKAQQLFNVKDFGAKGNGLVDDSKAINACFERASNYDHAEIIFPAGSYQCKSRLDLPIVGDRKIKIRGDRNNSTILFFTDININKGISIAGMPKDDAEGSVQISHLIINGPKTKHANGHPFSGSVRHMFGIGVSNIRNIDIESCDVTNVYGNGIDISNKASRVASEKSRFRNVTIQNCNIINCWGKSPTDSYGDGIYISDCLSFNLKNNTVENNREEDSPYGRAGIVIEDYTANGYISQCKINGYDRAIHVENSFGNIKITRNKMIGNITSIVLWSDGIRGAEGNLYVENNILSSTLFFNNNRNSSKEILVVKVQRKGRPKSKDIFRGNIIRSNSGAKIVLENFFKVESKHTSLINNRYQK